MTWQIRFWHLVLTPTSHKHSFQQCDAMSPPFHCQLYMFRPAKTLLQRSRGVRPRFYGWLREGMTAAVNKSVICLFLALAAFPTCPNARHVFYHTWFRFVEFQKFGTSFEIFGFKLVEVFRQLWKNVVHFWWSLGSPVLVKHFMLKGFWNVIFIECS